MAGGAGGIVARSGIRRGGRGRYGVGDSTGGGGASLSSRIASHRVEGAVAAGPSRWHWGDGPACEDGDVTDATGPIREAEGLIRFIDASPSPYHASSEAAGLLQAAGFGPLDPTEHWPAGGRHYLIHGGTLVAWAVGAGTKPSSGMRLVGAHTDSPNLRIRPQPDATKLGFRQLGVDVYGGALLNSWLDRDLGLSGRVVVRSGSDREVRLFRLDLPLLRIPQLAPHLDREVRERGVLLNAQTQLVPIWGLDGPEESTLVDLLGAELKVAPDQILGWDLMTHDLTPGRISGRSGEFVSVARLDNLGCTYTATRALVEHVTAGGDREPGVAAICLFDHEEVGSVSSSGAAGAILPSVLERVGLAMGGSREDLLRSLAGSACVSADMSHALNPNYGERYEPGHALQLNQGPAIKYNASQRYATDAVGAATFAAACEKAGVPFQRYVNRGDLPCGSTIGPITAARLGVDTVDVGMSQLAMHSARELGGSADPSYMVRALTAFLGS